MVIDKLDSLSSTVLGSMGLQTSFRMEFPTLTVNMYSPLAGTPFTYVPSASSISISAAPLELSPHFGKWSLNGRFSISTENGVSVTLY